MLAIHFICKREGGSLSGLSYDKATKTSRSGKWDVPLDVAQSLVGGWLYLHPAKAARSEFGGVILGVEQEVDPSLKRPLRVVFHVRSTAGGKDQAWRGDHHGLAHTGKPVAADYPHEQPG